MLGFVFGAEMTMGQRVKGHGSRVKWVNKSEWDALESGGYS